MLQNFQEWWKQYRRSLLVRALLSATLVLCHLLSWCELEIYDAETEIKLNLIAGKIHLQSSFYKKSWPSSLKTSHSSQWKVHVVTFFLYHCAQLYNLGLYSINNFHTWSVKWCCIWGSLWRKSNKIIRLCRRSKWRESVLLLMKFLSISISV